MASFHRYADAERTLGLLADTRFPVHRSALVGGDLKLVDEVSGRVTVARAGRWGACAGAWLGALMALFVFVTDRRPVGDLVVGLCWGVLLGTAFGAALGLMAYAGPGRGLAPRRRLVAARYELYVDAELAASAWRLLLKLNPAGLTLMDRVPVEVVTLPADMALIETFEPVEPSQPTVEPLPHPVVDRDQPPATGSLEAAELQAGAA